MSRTIKIFLCSLLTLLSQTGCDFKEIKDQRTARDLEQLEQLAGSLSEILGEHPDRTLGELKKLHQFEYNLFQLPDEINSIELESRLDQLGRKRWDCFHIERIAARDGKMRLTVFCKRRPETVLKYIPRQFLPRGG